MADRDRYDWDRERGRDDWDRDRGYGRGAERGRGYDDRGMVARGADEVRSWFGDDEARRRREVDEQRERQRDWSGERERGWAPNSESTRREHGWGASTESAPRWDDGRGRDQRMSESTREWYDRGPNAGGVWSSSHSYGFGAPDWSGAPSRGAGSSPSDEERRYPNGGGYGGYAAGGSGPAFSGGYGAGSYETGGYRTTGFGRESEYGRGQTGEGRWSGQGNASSGYGGFAGRGPRSYRRADDRICEDVNERLTADPRVDASDIEVRVQNGEVTLSGSVDDRRTRRLAEEIIEDLPGVRDVRNDLRVSRNEGWSQREGGEPSTGQSHSRNDGGIGNTGDPQKRDDVTTLNQTGKLNR
jgi:hypothetical protein